MSEYKQHELHHPDGRVRVVTSLEAARRARWDGFGDKKQAAAIAKADEKQS